MEAGKDCCRWRWLLPAQPARWFVIFIFLPLDCWSRAQLSWSCCPSHEFSILWRVTKPLCKVDNIFVELLKRSSKMVAGNHCSKLPEENVTISQQDPEELKHPVLICKDQAQKLSIVWALSFQMIHSHILYLTTPGLLGHEKRLNETFLLDWNLNGVLSLTVSKIQWWI